MRCQETKEIAARLGFERDVVIQFLLSEVHGGQNFDQMAGTGNIPMHQAKVLDRSERLRGAGAALRALCSARLPYLAMADPS